MGALYSAGPDKKFTERLPANGTLKGMAWSVSGNKFYRADYDQALIFQYDFELETGIVGK